MENTFNTKNLLDYEEIAEMQKDPKFRHKMLKQEFRKLTNRIIEQHIKEDTVDVDVAYRFEFKVIDSMNIVGKITSIPVLDVVLKRPVVEEPKPVYTIEKKYNLVERLKILFKGRV